MTRENAGIEDSTPSFVNSVVLRVEPQAQHKKFTTTNPPPSAVMISIEDVRILLQRGETASSYFPDRTTVITTTTVNDDILEKWDTTMEREKVLEFGSDYHIPCDYPVYTGDNGKRRILDIGRYLDDVTEFVEETYNNSVEAIPLVKGVTERERKLCYRRFDALDIQDYAYYCVQYFARGAHINELISDIRTIAGEDDPRSMMLIGFQSEKYLSELPPHVTSVAGQRWIRKSKLRDINTMRVNKILYKEWEAEVLSRLGEGTVPLNVYDERDKGGVSVGV